MSDIQTMIHLTTINCIERGKQQEHERIVKLLQEANSGKTHSASGSCGLCQAIELIKRETK